jgi:hypothetical protein
MLNLAVLLISFQAARAWLCFVQIHCPAAALPAA